MQSATSILVALFVYSALNFVAAVNNTEVEPTGRSTLGNCTNITLRSGEYSLLPDGALHIEVYDAKLESSAFVLWNDSVTICKSANVTEDSGIKSEPEWFLKLMEFCMASCAVVFSWFYVMVFTDPKSLLSGTFVVLSANLALLAGHFLLADYLGEPECVSLVLRFPALNHYFTMTFLFWYSVLVFDLTLCYQKGNEVVDPDTGRKRVQANPMKQPILYNNCIRALLIIGITQLLEILLDKKVQWPFYDEGCSKAIRIFFTYLLHSVAAYTVVGILNFLYSQRALLRKTHSVEKVMIMRNFFETHFALFILSVLTWLVSCMVITLRSDGFQNFVFSLGIFQLCVFIAILSLKQQFENGIVRPKPSIIIAICEEGTASISRSTSPAK